MKKIIIIAISLLNIAIIKAQTVENVHAKLKGQNVIIAYDLKTDGEKTKYTVELYISNKSRQAYRQIKTDLIGDVGKNIPVGKNRTITWNPFKDNPNYVAENAMFKVIAVNFEGYIETTAGLNLEMLAIKGGTFQMGSYDSDASTDEQPVHSVNVKNFYIGKYEVTQDQWSAIMGNNPSYFSGTNLPIEKVSWNDIQIFLKILNKKTGKNYRLPTEAEWEFAAKGGIETNRSAYNKNYSGNNKIDVIAWYGDNSGSKTHAVGTKQANELGIYDMSGNVWEWCNDWYSSDYYGRSLQNNPQGASSGFSRVLRGGSWRNYESHCRVANRRSYSPDYNSYNLGFRLACSQ